MSVKICGHPPFGSVYLRDFFTASTSLSLRDSILIIWLFLLYPIQNKQLRGFIYTLLFICILCKIVMVLFKFVSQSVFIIKIQTRAWISL